jgi:hypothetical protein
MNTETKAAAAVAPIAAPEPAVAAAPVWKEIRHPLTHPIPDPETGEMITEIVMREPDVEALERIDGLGMEEGKRMKVSQIRGLIAALSGLPDATIGKMHKNDFAAIGEEAVPLLEGAPGN